MPTIVLPTRRLLDLVRNLFQLTPSRYIYQHLIRAWTFLRYLLSFRRRGGGRSSVQDEEDHRELDKACIPAVRANTECTGNICAASVVPTTIPLPIRNISPSSRGDLEFTDALSRPVSVIGSTGPSSVAHGPNPYLLASRPHSYAGPTGNLLTPHMYGTPNTSQSSHDIAMHNLDSVSEVHRGRPTGLVNTLSPIPSERRPRRRSRSSHVSTGIATRRPRSPSMTSSGVSRRRFGRPSAAAHRPDTPASDVRFPAQTESSEYGIDVRSRSTSVASSDSLPDVHPTHGINRYERKIKLPKKQPDYQCNISAKSLTFPREGVPPGWNACAHPEGALYFFCKEGNIYTDANLCDPEVFRLVKGCIRRLQLRAESENLKFADSSALVIEPMQWDGDETTYWGYYCVDHTHRTLFWFDDYELPVHELDGEPTVSQLSEDVSTFIIVILDSRIVEHEMEYLYWYLAVCSFAVTFPVVWLIDICRRRMHVESFPYGHPTTPEVAQEIMGIIAFATVDQQTSPTSTVLYSVDDLQKMMSCAKHARRLGPSDYSTAIIGRLHQIFAHPRFLNYHGEYGARLNRDQSVHGTEKSARSLLVKLLAPALFNAPYVHLHALERIWVDSTMCHLPWGLFIEKLKSEWQEFTLFGTVLLNANVAFLAIPSVDLDPNVRRPSQILSYISVVLGIGSILTGLLLVRQYRVKPKDTVGEATAFLHSRTHPTRGVETLAILYSLPYALLLWSMLSFFVAFSYECFVAHNSAAIWAPGSVWIVVGFLILWCIYSAWEGKEDSWLKEKIATYKGDVYALWHTTPSFVRSHLSNLFPQALPSV